MRSSNSSTSDKETKERIRNSRKGGPPRSPGALPSEAASRGDPDVREKRDREAKQAARRLSSDEPPAKPGAQSSVSSEDRSARKQQRMRTEQQGGIGISASTSSEERGTRMQRQSKKLEEIGLADIGIGVSAGSSAGVETSSGNNLAPPTRNEPVDPSAYEVQAIAVNDDAEDERVRKLEAQMQAMMMSHAVALPTAQVTPTTHQNDSDDDDDDDDVSCCQKYKWVILLLALVAIGGGVAGYLLGQGDSEEAVVQATPAPSGNSVTTPSPNVQTTVVPTSAPTPFLIFDPPSDAECFAIANRVPLNDQEFFNTTSVSVSFDVSLTTDQDTNSWLTPFEQGLQSSFVPALAGCPTTRRQRRLLEKETNYRNLQSEESPSRYAIANADSSLAYLPNESCAIGAEQPCKRVQAIMDLYVKDEYVTFFDVVNIFYDVAGSDEAANVNVFGLSTDQFQGISIAGIENLSPTEAPTPNPTGMPTPTPPPTNPGTPRPTGRRDFLQALLSEHAPLHSRAFNWLANIDTWEPNVNAFNAEDQWRERYAMAVFYFSTGGDQWTDKENWLSSNSICVGPSSPGWFGINDCGNNRVLDLTIVANNLAGSLPTEIGLLQRLSSLAPFENSGLAGTIPTEIGLLTFLTGIELDITGLSGPIPSEIGELTRLREFFAFDSFISGSIPSEIGDTNLVTFEVYNTDLEGNIPEQLWSLTLLQELKVFNTNLDGTISTRIGQLSLLRVLEIDQCSFTGKNLSRQVQIME